MKKTLQNMKVTNKTVIVRVDYNVPILNGKILDDSKIIETLETINYLISENCKIILLSHLGKIKTEADKLKYSLEPVAKHLKDLVNSEVYFTKDIMSPDLKKRVSELKPQEILMLENTRFADLPKPLESTCDAQLSLFWSSLADVFVNDAFASAHRAHASNYGIAKYIPSCIGFLMQKELFSLNKLVINPEHPFVVVMGGAKMDDKIELMENLIKKCDYLLCAGGIANTCLKALDFGVGQSIVSKDFRIIDKLKKMMLENKEKFVLPLDAIVGSTYDENYVKYKRIDTIDDNDLIQDIGVKTLEKYQKVISSAKTIFLNGTLGMYENPKFANGTKEFFNMLSKTDAIVVVGGGDTSSAVKNLGYQNQFTYVSSGGGATLDYLGKEKLIALDVIEEGETIETLDL
ncbi:MAG: phosphoglycerate kinase [Bacilli bacterium]|nr:phosphoglycerate kinase [Bacilli bacterium]